MTLMEMDLHLTAQSEKRRERRDQISMAVCVVVMLSVPCTFIALIHYNLYWIAASIAVAMIVAATSLFKHGYNIIKDGEGLTYEQRERSIDRRNILLINTGLSIAALTPWMIDGLMIYLGYLLTALIAGCVLGAMYAVIIGYLVWLSNTSA